MADWEMNGTPGLLILHMQPGIVGEGSDMHPGNAKVVREAGIIPRQQALLKAFRARKLPVIYVNALPRPVEGPVPPYGTLWKGIARLKPQPPENARVIPELAPQPGEPVLTNWLFSPFNSSGLDKVLKVKRVDTLVLTGFATNGVIYAGLQEAADRYYPVILVQDACTSASAEAHGAITELIAPALSLVTTTEDVLAHLD